MNIKNRGERECGKGGVGGDECWCVICDIKDSNKSERAGLKD